MREPFEIRHERLTALMDQMGWSAVLLSRHGNLAWASAGALYAPAERAYAAERFAREIANHHQAGATAYREREWLARPDGPPAGGSSTGVRVEPQRGRRKS